MSHYEFTLKFAIPSDWDRSWLEARLFEGGCDDALMGTGQQGRLALSFSREAASASDAVTSAIRDVRNAVPAAVLVEVTPDFVGVSDVADLFGFSRQNMRKLVQTHRDSFPLPLHEGRSALWHLADVLEWFAREAPGSRARCGSRPRPLLQGGGRCRRPALWPMGLCGSRPR
ncbi:AlpA family transcriptional regulator, partial [Thioalkalivibrio sp. ALE23]|uniref:helix-turn-helix transcriptional regulator n=1 Tax=Thioalkalivibrio sp. ALE23 TaxID=1265495 RepID=UPI00035C2D6A